MFGLFFHKPFKKEPLSYDIGIEVHSAEARKCHRVFTTWRQPQLLGLQALKRLFPSAISCSSTLQL